MNINIGGYGPENPPRWRTIAAALAALGIVTGAVVTTQYLRGHSTTTGVLAAASTVQGGCNPYQVQALSIGTFNTRVCLSDNGTGTTAYPRVEVDQVPPYLGTSCTIALGLRNSNGNNDGTVGQTDCKTGTYPGKPFGPVTKQLTVYASVQLTICLITCTSYDSVNGQGDSPSIELQPFVVTTPKPSVAASTQTSPVPVPPLPPVAPSQQRRANCLNNRPVNGPTSIVEDNGDGWNEYTTENGPGTRPGTATACLDMTHGPGTPANQTITVVGMADALARVAAENISTDPPVPALLPREVNRCHLIAGANSGAKPIDQLLGAGGSLGGNGNEPSNLVPCWGRSTNIGRNGMSRQESTVRNLADHTNPGEAIYYQVTPVYESLTSTIPTKIVLVAYLQLPGDPGLGQRRVNATAENTLEVDTATGRRTLMLGN
jgi:hypothetical protein